MERKEVESTAVRSIGYDPAQERLEIEFRSGKIYAYEGVPASVHEWLLRIKGKGAFIQRVLVPSYTAYEVLPEERRAPLDLEAALRASLEALDDSKNPY